MPIDQVILGGIGSAPGSIEFFITDGLTQGVSTVSGDGVSVSAGVPITSSGVVATVVNNTGAALAGTTWMNGFAIAPGNKLQISTNSVAANAVWVNGVACTPFGAVYVTTIDAVQASTGGYPLSGQGSLCVVEADGPEFWANGIPVDDSGRVSVGSVT